EVQRTATNGSTTTTESLLYTYSFGQVSNVVLRRQVNGGAWTTISQAVDTYYAFMESNGNYRDLKLVQIEDGAGTVLDTKYMRYYRGGEAGGYAKALKYVFGPQSYARLVVAFPDPTSASDAQVAPYADLYL